MNSATEQLTRWLLASIAQVAEQVGYQSEPAFSNAFKQLVDRQPRAYPKNLIILIQLKAIIFFYSHPTEMIQEKLALPAHFK